MPEMMVDVGFEGLAFLVCATVRELKMQEVGRDEGCKALHSRVDGNSVIEGWKALVSDGMT